MFTLLLDLSFLECAATYSAKRPVIKYQCTNRDTAMHFQFYRYYTKHHILRKILLEFALDRELVFITIIFAVIVILSFAGF